jgi:hypothetical protein
LTISERQNIPDDLPPARLYLDDVEEIVALFNKGSDPDSTKTVFSVGRFNCTTVDELKQLGTRSTNFRIKVTSASHGADLQIDKFRTSWYYDHIDGGLDDSFRIYGQLQALFSVRKIRWKAALLSIPVWMQIVLALFLVTLASALSVKEHLPLGPGFRERDVLSFSIISLFTVWLVYKTVVEHSVVEFCRVHDAQGLRRRLAEWKPYIIAAIAAIIGAFSKEMFELIAHALKKP